MPVQHERLIHLRNVRRDIEMRQHHALRIARTSARKNNRRQIIEPRQPLAAKQALEQRRRKRPKQKCNQPLTKPRLRRHILNQNRSSRHLHRQTIEQQLRRNHRFKLALLGARSQRLVRRRIIQIHGNLPAKDRREVHIRARHRRRQQNPYHFLPRPQFPQSPRQKYRAQQRRAPFHARSAHVRHRKSRRVPVRRSHQRFPKRLQPSPPVLKRVALQILHRLSHFEHRRRRSQRLAEAHRNRIRKSSRQLPQKSPFLETKDAAPNSIEAHRHNRRVHALHHPLKSPPEREQIPDARNLPLGKNANNLAAANRLARLMQRGHQLARPLLR